MLRRLILLLVLVALALPSVAGEAPPPAATEKPAPPQVRVTYRWWLVPVYLVIGLPRDLIDAPVKGISSIPILNRVLIAPLMIFNNITSALSWSLTREGVDGGFEAWVACMKLPRKHGTRTPEWFKNRPWWKNYFPNWRTLIVKITPLPPKPEDDGQ